MCVVTLHCSFDGFFGISTCRYISMGYAVASKLLCRFYEALLYQFWQGFLGEHRMLSGIQGLTVGCWCFMVVLWSHCSSYT